MKHFEDVFIAVCYAALVMLPLVGVGALARACWVSWRDKNGNGVIDGDE